MTPEFKILLKKRNRIETSIKKKNAELTLVEDEIRKTCQHEIKVPRQRYNDSGYYDPATVEYWDECSVCGETVNWRRKVIGFH